MKTSVATTIAIALAALAFQSIPGWAEHLQWNRQNPVSPGIITGHLSHWSWDHFVWDIAAFLTLAFTVIRLMPERLGICLVLASFAIPLEVFLFHSQVETYRGLSGIDSALFGLVVAALWNRGSLPRTFALVGAVLFLGKTGLELLTGGTLFVSNQGNTDFTPVPSTHLTGAICGLLSGMKRINIKVMPSRISAC